MLDEGSLLIARQAQGGGGGGGGPGGNPNQGRHRSSGSSVSALLSTLIPVFLLASLLFVAFLLLRNRIRRIYQPRSYLGSVRTWQRSPEQSPGLFGWTSEFFGLKDEYVMGHASLDNYLWVRFMRMLAVMCFVGCIITWPILFPINATGAGGQDGLDILSFSNITPGVRYYAQVFVSWVFLAWVMFMVTRETRFFVRLRQHYYMAPGQSSLISSKTVLFSNVPEEKRSLDAIRKEFDNVKAAWFVDVSKELAEQVEERDDVAYQLEQAEIKLAQKYSKQQSKSTDKKDASEGGLSVDHKLRPTHRLKKLKVLPLGAKVDSINWSRSELKRLLPAIEASRRQKTPAQGACFVEFDTVESAFCAMTRKSGMKDKTSLTAKEYAPSPENVLWDNITKSFWKVQAMNIAATAFVVFLCLFWSIPTAVIGAISNINYLTTQVPFLSFIDNIPDVILGVVTGLLPVLLLAVLMALVPIILALLAKRFEPTLGAVQMKVQKWYFPFQVIQVFLITTFASGAASVAAQIVGRPSSAVTLLAQNLPKASNFYISYFILFGLLSAMIQLLNLVPMLLLYVLGRLMDKTPRKKYDRYSTLAGLGWGPLYAKFANLGVIALSYSSIAPLVLGFATIGFYILYLAFRYNVLFTLGTNVSTRGASYRLAMQQLITGIYLSELCLIGLFAIGSASSTQAVGPLVLQVVFLIATVAWHIWLNRSLSKLETDFPEQPKTEDKEEGTLDGVGHGHRYGWKGRLQGFFHPDQAGYNASTLVSSCLFGHEASYTDEQHRLAYMHPAASSECPQLWIARDKHGLSKQEIAKTKEEIGLEMSDEGAWIDEKGKLSWTQEVRDCPIWEEPVRY